MSVNDTTSSGEGNPEALQRSEDAIDEARDAAAEALDSPQPGDDLEPPQTGQAPGSDQEEVIARPI